MTKYLSAKELDITPIERKYAIAAVEFLKNTKTKTRIIDGMKVAFEMDSWGALKEDDFDTPGTEKKKAKTLCNTSGCLAGHIVFLAYANGELKKLTNITFPAKKSFKNKKEQLQHYYSLMGVAESWGESVRDSNLHACFYSYLDGEEAVAMLDRFLRTGSVYETDTKVESGQWGCL